MAPSSETATASVDEQYQAQHADADRKMAWKWSRQIYSGALLFNIAAFVLPALYATLSKFWVANIDSSMVVISDAYTYIGVVAEVLNEGLSRAAWNIIADKSNRTIAARHGLSYTLILFQTVVCLIMAIAFVAAAKQFANTLVPAELSRLSFAIETAVTAATRSLDKPDVPLVISSVKFAVNITLDLIVISKFHIPQVTPTVNTQAATQLACNMVASLTGLTYFVLMATRDRGKHRITGSMRSSFSGLKILPRPGFFTFTESAIRNALYLWLVSGVVAMGWDYITAWGIFNTIR